MAANKRTVLVITLSWVSIATLLFLFAHFYLVITLPDQGDLIYQPIYNYSGYVLATLLGGLLFGYSMVFPSYYRTRRKRFSYGILYNTIAFLVVYVITSLAVTFGISLLAAPELSFTGTMRVVLGVLTNPATLINMLIWAVIVAITQFILQVNDKFGQGVLWNFLTGRYFHPREEERIFMFLDITGSTTIAERIGHTKYFQFLRDFIADITDPILAHRGQIYQYVGDEVVISWRLNDLHHNTSCIRCFYAIVDHMNAMSYKYENQYGITPRFKAGIHAGNVTVGELGVVKKDLVFTGDVLNTTSRIQGECHNHRSILLLSAYVLSHVALNEEFTAQALGSIHLKGKKNPIMLHTVHRTGSPLLTPPANHE